MSSDWAHENEQCEWENVWITPQCPNCKDLHWEQCSQWNSWNLNWVASRKPQVQDNWQKDWELRIQLSRAPQPQWTNSKFKYSKTRSQYEQQWAWILSNVKVVDSYRVQWTVKGRSTGVARSPVFSLWSPLFCLLVNVDNLESQQHQTQSFYYFTSASTMSNPTHNSRNITKWGTRHVSRAWIYTGWWYNERCCKSSFKSKWLEY